MRLLAVCLSLSLTFTCAAHAHEGHEGHGHAEAAPADSSYLAAIAEGAGPHYVGEGEQRYEIDLAWLRNVEEGFRGPTHGGVAVAADGTVYVSTDTEKGVYALSPAGETLLTLGPATQYLHALTLVTEAGEEVLYGVSPANKNVVKFTPEGEVLMTISQETAGDLKGGWKGVNGLTVAPDGRIYASTGYGADYVHVFSATGEHLSTFGGRGKATDEGKFRNAHGMAIDTRQGNPLLMVANRGSNRLDHFTLDGEFVAIHSAEVSLPCVPNFHGDLCGVAELDGRVTLLDKSGAVAARLGANPVDDQRHNFKVAQSDWKVGVFTAPHGLAFGPAGEIYVQDWNETGRVTKLTPAPE
ncbi:NHL repeat protein [Pseudobythopirellula maris]|uniref:NHL repeat protein n=1 Tax=Pseudobythopirellula maris TaxID=2527991 RepID=A0A5C5ZPA0_9BACT|nr:hypothetical protein [Pseudobythopirellula maris]TWT88996.1 NHL repeat protein [Pseudobythopirellula maris]